MFSTFLLWVIRLSVCSTGLLAASTTDLREREVPDALWLITCPAAAVLTALWLARYPEALFSALLSISMSAALAALIYWSGLMGGADAKAIMFIALSVPLGPGNGGLLGTHPFVPLASFSNALLASALLSTYMMIRNLSWKLKRQEGLFEGIEASLPIKALVFISGYKVKAEETVRSSSLFPLEEITLEEGRVRRRLVPFVRIDEQRLGALEEALRGGLAPEYIWASPGLPFVAFLTLGFFLAISLGDLLFYVIITLLSGLFA